MRGGHHAGGRTLGVWHSRYIVREPVGCGTVSRLYRAYDVKLRRDVAPKDFESLDSDAVAGIVARQTEIAKIGHVNTVRLYDVQAFGGRVLIAMEWFEGTTFEQ